MNLRNSRLGTSDVTTVSVGGKSGTDLLADGDDDSTTVLPKVIAAGAIVFICAVTAIVFGLSNMNKPADAPVASNIAPTAQVKEVFTDRRTSQSDVVQQTSYVPPPPRVFLPPNVTTMSDSFRSSAMESTSVSVHQSSKLSHGDLVDDFGIGGVRLTNSRKPNGEMICYGSLKIYNRSIDNIVDFDIYLVSAKKKYLVKPFIGTLENMEPLESHVVHAKEALTLPIYVEGYKGKPGNVEGHVTVIATLDSTPKLQYFEAEVGKPIVKAPAPKGKKG